MSRFVQHEFRRRKEEEEWEEQRSGRLLRAEQEDIECEGLAGRSQRCA